MPTIYRQYRPQTFAELMGQNHITETLQQAILKKRISHAYLFQGPRGTGKTSTARIFAKRINCTKSKDAEPCNKCDTCVATQKNQNIDLIEIDAASNRGIDDIKALREATSIRPANGEYKVYIIDEVHMLSHDAFGALLKILEEPPAHVVFILATTELHKVPATILSRCQLYRFRRATSAEMKQRLEYILKAEKRDAEESLLQFIINRSDGCYRDAESLLGQILTLQDNPLTSQAATQLLGLPSVTLITDFLAAVIKGDSATAITLVDTAYEEGLDIEQFLREAIRVARDGAVQLAKKSTELPVFAQQPNAAGRLPNAIRAFLQAIQDLAYVPQPLIAIHLAVLTLAAPQATQVAPVAPAAKPQAPAPIKPIITQPIAQTKPAPSSGESKVADAASSQPYVSSGTAPVANATFTVESVQAVWGQVILAIKDNSPVASTFLRATEPSTIEGNTLILKAQYPLHKNFFDKPDNKATVEQAIAKLIGQPVGIRCQLNTTATPIKPMSAPMQAQAAPQNGSEPAASNELYDAVKEVFGKGPTA